MALGGVGEAMLLGAAMGGGSAALTGGDPLKGALFGAATGGLGGGIGAFANEGIAGLQTFLGATEGAAGAAGSAGAGASQGIKALADPTAQQVAGQLGVQGAQTGAGSQAAMLADQMSGFGPQGLESLRSAAGSAIPSGAPVSSAITPSGTAVQQAALPKTAPEFLKDPTGYLKANKWAAIGGGLGGALGAQRKITPPERKKIEGLPIWAYRAKEGGIASLAGGGMPGYDMVVGETPMYAQGGVSDLGSYSDGGRMLKGAGDGMSDSIPGMIAGKRPARLADGEFVVPADVVSHLGNGSTDAGAKQLYAMMDKVRAARTGTKKQGRQINPRRFMPA